MKSQLCSIHRHLHLYRLIIFRKYLLSTLEYLDSWMNTALPLFNTFFQGLRLLIFGFFFLLLFFKLFLTPNYRVTWGGSAFIPESRVPFYQRCCVVNFTWHYFCVVDWSVKCFDKMLKKGIFWKLLTCINKFDEILRIKWKCVRIISASACSWVRNWPGAFKFLFIPGIFNRVITIIWC